MALSPSRTVAELKELRELTGDSEGAQRVAWTETWSTARKWLDKKLSELPVEKTCDAAGNQFLLRTIRPPLSDADGRPVQHLRRIGKRIAIGVEGDVWLVLHLMIAGRL